MLIALLATILLALYSSNDDFKEIVAGKKIRHVLQWLFRAVVVTLVCHLMKCLLFAIPLAFLFSALFRYNLNKKRGENWRYVSWSNWHNTAFLCFYQFGWLHMWGIKVARIMHGRMYKEVKEYRRDVHRAGTMAYIFEAIIFTAGSILYLLYARNSIRPFLA